MTFEPAADDKPSVSHLRIWWKGVPHRTARATARGRDAFGVFEDQPPGWREESGRGLADRLQRQRPGQRPEVGVCLGRLENVQGPYRRCEERR